MNSGKRILLYSVAAAGIVTAALTGFILWKNHKQEEILRRQRLLEADEGVLIQVLMPEESLESGSDSLRQAVSEFRRDIKDGYAPMMVFENAADNEIVMIRVLPEAELQQAGSTILDHEELMRHTLKELKPLHDELTGVLERAVFRLEAVSGPAFQDDAYRLSLGRAEKIWQERLNRIEELDSTTDNKSQDRRAEIKRQIGEAQAELKALALSDTDARVPIIKRMRELKAELASLSLTLTPASSALQRYPALYLQLSEKDLFAIPKDETERQRQILTFKRWITFLKADLIATIREDLKEHATATIEVRRRRLFDTGVQR